MTKEIAAAFDYSKVATETKGRLIYFAKEIKKTGERHLSAGLELGKCLAGARDELGEARAGLFVDWVESECDLSKSTAYNYIATYERALNFPIIGKLSTTVAALLAPASVPDAAIREAEKVVNRAGKITVAKAKEILDKFREAKPTKPKPAPKAGAEPAAVSPSDSRDSRQSTGDTPPSATDGSSEAAATPGPCPKGGEHVLDDDGDCSKCKEPGWYLRGEPEPKDEPAEPLGTTKATKFNDKDLESSYGKLSRGMENRAKAMGGKGPHYEKTKQHLCDFLASWNEWRRAGAGAR